MKNAAGSKKPKDLAFSRLIKAAIVHVEKLKTIKCSALLLEKRIDLTDY